MVRLRGLSLLELLIFVSLFAGLSVATLHVLAEGRLLRARARDRQELALIAQSELDRIRVSGLRDVQKKETIITRSEWHQGVELAVLAEDGPASGTIMLEVTARWKGLDGLAPVQLVTLIPAPDGRAQ